jgi:hypothetical protein
VVDEVVRRDRLLGDPEVPPFPALRGLRWVLDGQQVVPAQGAPSVLPGQQAQGVGIERGFDLASALCPVPTTYAGYGYTA